MSDRYVHHFHDHTVEQYDNLLKLARHLVVNANKIDAAGGLLFDHVHIMDFAPLPQDLAVYPPP